MCIEVLPPFTGAIGHIGSSIGTGMLAIGVSPASREEPMWK